VAPRAGELVNGKCQTGKSATRLPRQRLHLAVQSRHAARRKKYAGAEARLEIVEQYYRHKWGHKFQKGRGALNHSHPTQFGVTSEAVLTTNR